MLTISRPLSAGQAQSYHKLEFTSEAQSYYKQDGAVEGQWQGKLAEKFGLSGPVTAEAFTLLTEGKHPETEQQMVKHRAAQEYTNADGTTTKAVEHRAAWDATFSAPKSVSLTALVGGDDRVREAHAAAVTTALTELERYTQARIGGNNPAETTGKFIAAKFEHDTARPVDGYAAPQLHTHAVIFNVTERADGSTRALQPKALFDSQSFATAVYQSALTYELRNRGYEIETGRSGAPFPDLDAGIPISVRSIRPKEYLRLRPSLALLRKHRNGRFAEWIEPVLAIAQVRKRSIELDEDIQSIWDDGPLPNWVLAFQPNDVVMQAFDEEAQSMYESSHAPTWLDTFNPCDPGDVRRVLSHVRDLVAINLKLVSLSNSLERSRKHARTDRPHVDDELRAA